MGKSLKEFEGKEAIFIDANIFLHHAFDLNPVSTAFLRRIETSNLKSYTSALVMEEITFKLIMQAASNLLRRVTIYDVKRALKDGEKRMKILKPVMEYRAYIDVLKDFGLTILELTDRDMAIALEKARSYGVLVADAAHLAVMERKGIAHLASSDTDFQAVSGIVLWSPNDER